MWLIIIEVMAYDVNEGRSWWNMRLMRVEVNDIKVK